MSSFPLPKDLPVSIDDGACNHLPGAQVASASISATDGSLVDLSALSGLTIVFCYPRTGAPGEKIPPEWDAIPGARGCSPQACSFNDAAQTLYSAGVKEIFGLSTQDTEYQREAKGRLGLAYQLLSDEKLEFTKAMKLPTFDWNGKELTKRITLAIEDGKIVKVWYPVFPSHVSASWVLDWLKNKSIEKKSQS